MTTGGHGAGNLGDVWINVVPSMAGSQQVFQAAAAQAAAGYSGEFKDRLGQILPAALEDVLLAGSRTLGPALAQSLFSGGDIRASVRTWAQSIQSEMANELRALPLSMPTGSYLAGAAKEMSEASAAANAARVKDLRTTHAELEIEQRAHQQRMNTFSSGSYLAEMSMAAREANAARINDMRSSYTEIEAEERAHQVRMSRETEESVRKAYSGGGAMGIAARQAYADMGRQIEEQAKAESDRITSALFNPRTATVGSFSVFREQWKQAASEMREGHNQAILAAAEAGATAGHGFSSEYMGALQQLFPGVSSRLSRFVPLFQSHGRAAGQAMLQATQEEMAKLGPDEFVDKGNIQANAAAKMADIGKVMGAAGKVAIVGAGVTAGIEFVRAIHTSFKEVEHIGEEAASTLVSSFKAVMSGKMPDLMAPFNVLEDSAKTAMLIPLQMAEVFVPPLRIIKHAVEDMFGPFDQLKEVITPVMEEMLQVGDQYLRLQREMVKSSLEPEKLKEMSLVVREIMASGAVVHFEDVADSIGRLNQNIQGLSEDKLKELVTNFAMAEELVGKIDETKFAGIINAWKIPGAEANETLTMLTNTSRATGVGINLLTDEMTRSGPSFRDLGYNAEQTAAFFGEMTAQGEKGTRLIFAMAEADKKLNEQVENGNFPTAKAAWQALVETVKQYEDAGKHASAMHLLEQYVTPSTAGMLTEMIKAGKVSAESLGDAIKDVHSELSESVEKTKDLGQTFEVLEQQIGGALAPMGMVLAGGLRDAGNHVTEWLKENQGKVAQWGADIAKAFLNIGTFMVVWFADILKNLSPLFEAMKAMVLAVTLPLDTLAHGMSAVFGGGWTTLADALHDVNSGLMNFDIGEKLDRFSKAAHSFSKDTLPKWNAGLQAPVDDIKMEEGFKKRGFKMWFEDDDPAKVKIKGQTKDGKDINDASDVVPPGETSLTFTSVEPAQPKWHGQAPPTGFAFGGPTVQGQWVPGKDSIPAMLEVGEYVVRRDQAQKHRRELDAINYGYAGFDSGGEVDPGLRVLFSFLRGVAGGFGLDIPKDKSGSKDRDSMSGSLPGSLPPGAFQTSTAVAPTASHSGSVKEQAYQAMLAAGGKPSDFGAIDYIFQHESSWDVTAVNRTDINAQHGDPSQGLGQLISGNYRAAGVDPSSKDAYQQTYAAVKYMQSRYGGIQQAYQYWQGHQNYAEGGDVGGGGPYGPSGPYPNDSGAGSHGSDNPNLPDWWRKRLQAPIPINNAWMPNNPRDYGPGMPRLPWMNPSKLPGKGGIGGYAHGGEAGGSWYGSGDHKENKGLTSGNLFHHFAKGFSGGGPACSECGGAHPAAFHDGGIAAFHDGGGVDKYGVNTTGAQIDTIQVADALAQLYPGHTQHLYNAPDGFNEHSSGEAIDFMVGSDTALGYSVKDWALQQPGVKYALWQQKEWDKGGGVSAMPNRGTPTQNHMDHVHIRTEGGGFPQGGGPGPQGTGTMPAGTSSTAAAAPTVNGVQLTGSSAFGGVPQGPGGSGAPTDGSAFGGGSFPPGSPIGPGGLIGPGYNPWTNPPPGLSPSKRDEYTHQYEVWQLEESKRQRSHGEAQDALTEAITEQKDAYIKWKALDDQWRGMSENDRKLNTKMHNAEGTGELDKAVAKLDSANAKLEHTKDTAAQDQLDDQVGHPPPKPGKEGGERHGPEEGIAQQLGGGLIKGIFQELGLPDVFGKPFTQWGIWKLLMGGLGFGMNVANTWSERAMNGDGGPLAGMVPGGGGFPGSLPDMAGGPHGTPPGPPPGASFNVPSAPPGVASLVPPSPAGGVSRAPTSPPGASKAQLHWDPDSREWLDKSGNIVEPWRLQAPASQGGLGGNFDVVKGPDKPVPPPAATPSGTGAPPQPPQKKPTLPAPMGPAPHGADHWDPNRGWVDAQENPVGTPGGGTAAPFGIAGLSNSLFGGGGEGGSQSIGGNNFMTGAFGGDYMKKLADKAPTFLVGLQDEKFRDKVLGGLGGHSPSSPSQMAGSMQNQGGQGIRQPLTQGGTVNFVQNNNGITTPGQVGAVMDKQIQTGSWPGAWTGGVSNQ